MGLMGIQPNAGTATMTTLSRLTPGTLWAELDHIPVWSGEVNIRHDGQRQSTLSNRSGRTITWEARFYGRNPQLKVNGLAQRGTKGRDEAGRPTVTATVIVKAGDKCAVNFED
jgi:hypothetical protein